MRGRKGEKKKKSPHSLVKTILGFFFVFFLENKYKPEECLRIGKLRQESV